MDGGHLENDQKSANFAKILIGPISNINQYIKLYLYVKFDAFCSKRTIRIIYNTKRLVGVFSCNDVDVLFTFNFDLDLKLAFSQDHKTQMYATICH